MYKIIYKWVLISDEICNFYWGNRSKIWINPISNVNLFPSDAKVKSIQWLIK